jgi:hypothetical protein
MCKTLCPMGVCAPIHMDSLYMRCGRDPVAPAIIFPNSRAGDSHDRSRRPCSSCQWGLAAAEALGLKVHRDVTTGSRVRQIPREEAEIAVECLRDWGIAARILDDPSGNPRP